MRKGAGIDLWESNDNNIPSHDELSIINAITILLAIRVYDSREREKEREKGLLEEEGYENGSSSFDV